jgi:hypothetical protein
MFTVMALSACSWALVLGYYTPESGKLSDLVTDLAAILDVYTGGLLVLESRAAPHNDSHITIAPLQRLALILLLFIAAPRAIEISAPEGILAELPLSLTKAIVSGVLVIIGFASLGLGARGIASPWAFGLLVVILVVYGSGNVVYNLIRFSEPASRSLMSPPVAYGFAILKIVLSLVLSYIVALHGMTKEMRAAGLIYCLLHFFYLAPPLPGPEGGLHRRNEKMGDNAIDPGS